MKTGSVLIQRALPIPPPFIVPTYYIFMMVEHFCIPKGHNCNMHSFCCFFVADLEKKIADLKRNVKDGSEVRKCMCIIVGTLAYVLHTIQLSE